MIEVKWGIPHARSGTLEPNHQRWPFVCWSIGLFVHESFQCSKPALPHQFALIGWLAKSLAVINQEESFTLWSLYSSNPQYQSKSVAQFASGMVGYMCLREMEKIHAPWWPSKALTLTKSQHLSQRRQQQQQQQHSNTPNCFLSIRMNEFPYAFKQHNMSRLYIAAIQYRHGKS